MINKLQNKVCLIIGGSRGIGFAISQRLWELGAKVTIASQNIISAKKASLKIDSKLRNLKYFKTDVKNESQVNKVVKKVIQKHGKIDILICTAGIFEPISAFSNVPFKKHEQSINTNLIGVMRCCHRVIPHMMKKKSGKIILFCGAGVGGDTPLQHASSYFVSKGALALFAEVLAAELSPFNIKVNAISPGRILTDATKANFRRKDKQLGKILSKITRELKETGGEPIEPVLNLVTFLCSNSSDKISGKLLSAKWDNIVKLKKNISSSNYTLRRIDQTIYFRKN